MKKVTIRVDLYLEFDVSVQNLEDFKIPGVIENHREWALKKAKEEPLAIKQMYWGDQLVYEA